MLRNLVAASARAARDALVELVVVAGAVHPDLPHRADAGRRIEAPGRDAHALAARHLPEQRRAALGAEPAPSVVFRVRAVDPAKPALLCEPDLGDERVRSGPSVTRPAPALRAMAQDDIAQAPLDIER